MSDKSGRPTPERVILIQADDLGYDDIGCNGNSMVETPHLDRLRGRSVNCTDFTVNPVCAPSRATLLTGRHFLKTGVSHVHGGKDFLAKSEQTLGDLFAANEWATALYGKWHSGNIEGYFPWERGFHDAYMAQLYRHRNCFGWLNGEKVEHGRWSDEVIFDYAIDCLKSNRDRPLFLYLSTLTPHAPLEASDELVAHYCDKGLSRALSTLYAMVTFLDSQIGRLVAFLEAEGMLEHTLLLFTSDNGPAINHGILSDEDRAIRKTSIRRGWKGDLYENGVRAPLYIHWPARYRACTIAAPLDQIDLFPTLMEWCGLEREGELLALDGKSVVGLFDKTTGADTLSSPIYNYAHAGWLTGPRPYTPTGLPGEYNPVTPAQKKSFGAQTLPVSVREGMFKLLLNAEPPSDDGVLSGACQLVDLAKDPAETTDVSEQYPEIARELQRKLDDWVSAVKAEPSSFGHAHIMVKGTTTIPAKLISNCSSDLQNTASHLQGWNRAGQFAEYLLDVKSPGTYHVQVAWNDQSPAGRVVFDCAGPAESTATRLTLPAGETVLRLTCVEADVAGPGKVLQRVVLVKV